MADKLSKPIDADKSQHQLNMRSLREKMMRLKVDYQKMRNELLKQKLDKVKSKKSG